MGAARAKRLRVVDRSSSGEAVVLEVGAKTTKRLAALYAASQAAASVARAAAHQANAVDAQYKQALDGILEVHGLEVTLTTPVKVDLDRGIVTVGPTPQEPDA